MKRAQENMQMCPKGKIPFSEGREKMFMEKQFEMKEKKAENGR